MPYAKKKNNHKELLIISIIVTVIAIAAAGLFVWHIYRQNEATKARLIEEATPRIVVPMEYFVPVNCEKKGPSGVKAVTVYPGVDFYTDKNADEKTVSDEIDKVLEKVKTFSMNSVLVDTKMENKVIFSSDSLQSVPVDAMKIFCKKAAEKNIAVSAVFHATDINAVSGSTIKSHLIPQYHLLLCSAVSELAGYSVETIELTDYYVERNGENFSKYVSYGDFGDYGLWLKKSVNAIIEDLCEAVHNTKPDLPVGIDVSSVWANSSETAEGSNTKASFQSLTNGYADTKSLVEEKAVDFVDVCIKTSRSDSAVPFKTAASWWGSLCKKNGIPMYITHAGENVCSNKAGWNGTDELARQVSAALKIDGYQGSAFSGLSKLIENPSGSTDNLVKYLNGEYNDKELNTDLTISLPEKKSFITYKERQQFRMKFDPNQEVFLDNAKVTPTERGGASIWKELKVGNNTFTLKHKGKTITYNIERRVIIFQSVSPVENMKVAGSSSIEFNVMAYKGSSVTATLNGKTVKLKEGGAGEDNAVHSAYVNFTGEYTVPKATAKEQKIGSIVFKGIYQGYPATKTGASITVDKRPDEVDPDEMTGKVYAHAIVKDDYAYTYPYLTTPKYPQGILYQLPKGTQDVILSKSGNFLNLRSGITVHKSEADIQNKAFVGNNRINKMYMGVENNDTVLRMEMGWKAPFSLSLSPYPSSPPSGKGYQFIGNTVTILLDYTTYIDTKNISGSFDGSPIFSGAPTMKRVKNPVTGIYQYKLTLPLNKQGRYYGCHSEWEGNTLVFRFNNPPAAGGTLDGMKICVDAGHGGRDNGTMAGSDILEKEATLIIAEKLESVLQSLGADVIMTRTEDVYVSLSDRVTIANNNNVDMLIACHYNSADWNTVPRGAETFFNAPFSQPLAYCVQQQLAQYMNNRGAKGPAPSYNFLVTREKQFPSILIEFGFLSNPEDEALAQDPDHQDATAAAVGQGVLDYYAAYN